MLGWLAGWIAHAISVLGYGGVALLMAAESACMPLPSEIIMPFAGYLVSVGRFGLLPVALAGAVGCNLGSAVAYAVGARGGRAFVLRYGRWLLLDAKDLSRAEWFFRNFGAPTVLVARLLPVVRTFIALPAGTARMKLLPFHALTFVGSFAWCLALAWIGDELGRRWNSDPRLAAAFHAADKVMLVLLVLAVAWFVWHRLRRRAA
jgi:membrane protein DedA with SNARE-associated domain